MHQCPTIGTSQWTKPVPMVQASLNRNMDEQDFYVHFEKRFHKVIHEKLLKIIQYSLKSIRTNFSEQGTSLEIEQKDSGRDVLHRTCPVLQCMYSLDQFLKGHHYLKMNNNQPNSYKQYTICGCRSDYYRLLVMKK